MQPIDLGTSGLRAPQLGFGCSALLGRSGRAESLRALATAWDAGVRFFDTARSYGYGESEALLGEFLQGRRGEAVIATKFGITPRHQSVWNRAAKLVARKALAIMPSARSMIQKRAATQFSPCQFTIPVLQQSIAESLRKLKTDCVDMLFIHAAPASVLEQDDLLEAMGRLVEAGKVRVAGLSAETAVVELAFEQRPESFGAMQFPCNVFEISSSEILARQNSSDCILVANHPFGGTARVQQCRAILQALTKGPELDMCLQAKLGNVEDNVLADVVLNAILHESGIHIVIPAMMGVNHIRANVQAITDSRFDTVEIGQIRRALSAGSLLHAVQ